MMSPEIYCREVPDKLKKKNLYIWIFGTVLFIVVINLETTQISMKRTLILWTCQWQMSEHWPFFFPYPDVGRRVGRTVELENSQQWNFKNEVRLFTTNGMFKNYYMSMLTWINLKTKGKQKRFEESSKIWRICLKNYIYIDKCDTSSKNTYFKHIKNNTVYCLWRYTCTVRLWKYVWEWQTLGMKRREWN